ncbi:hypothetical protein SYNPS1DRAFT_31420 [Syncephalis pseudoplumigaleata]|uniref:Uncharacterized protein n=1 Tax=Syncephalis pseudoplumigaleata TaxID=1712513 RepID=A0A4P9YSL4_9FUNG|nr:hypothetical protein SYNPS1DRAFT_31420 [Syncephalis pseudoplumigaleata]|eukprot:RKP22906.1 hypothetical protein SYNPS1DRAFT_31420 [Syncephalis pseudoplumigaleata]
MTWSLSDVIKLNLTRGKPQRELMTPEDELDEANLDGADSAAAQPVGVMTRADSAPVVNALADGGENTEDLGKGPSKHRANQSVSTLLTEELGSPSGISILTSPTALKMSPQPKGSMSSITSASENSSNTIVSPATSPFPASPTVATITSPMMRMPSLTDLALTAQAAHHREATGTAVGRIIVTLQSITSAFETAEAAGDDGTDGARDPAIAPPDLARLTGSLTAQSVAVLSTVQQLHSALAGIMLPKSLIDTAAVSTHADRGQRLMDAFRELDGIRSQLLQEAQLLSATVRKARSTGEALPTADLVGRANRILQASDAAVAGARAVARQKEVLSRLLARDQVALVSTPTSETDEATATMGGHRGSSPTSPAAISANGGSGTGSPTGAHAATMSFETRMLASRRTRSIGQLRGGMGSDGGGAQPTAALPRHPQAIQLASSRHALGGTGRRGGPGIARHGRRHDERAAHAHAIRTTIGLACRLATRARCRRTTRHPTDGQHGP